MRFLVDFLPVIVFFVAYKLFGIIEATIASMVCCGLQVVYSLIRHRKVPFNLWLTGIIIGTMGTLTIVLKNLWFIKMKPTALYWIMALVVWGSRRFRGKLIFELLDKDNVPSLSMESQLIIHRAFIGFFIMMGAVNWWVASHFSTNTWVHFKLFGSLGMSLIFMLALALYLSRMTQKEQA